MIAFLSFTFSQLVGVLGGWEALFPIGEFQWVIERILLTVSSFLFYVGYILPDWIKKLLLKNES